MAGYEAGLTHPQTPFGEFRFIPDDCPSGRRVASTLGLLAHQLVHGSDRRSPEVFDGTPVSISVSAGPVASFWYPRVHAAVLTPASIVAVEDHDLFEYRDKVGCSPSGCAGIRELVVVSPMEDHLTKTVRSSVAASTGLLARDGVMLDRVAEAAYDGASGYGESTPLDPRDSSLAREVLAGMRELGHVFLDPALEAYADQLVGPAAVSA